MHEEWRKWYVMENILVCLCGDFNLFYFYFYFASLFDLFLEVKKFFWKMGLDLYMVNW